MLFEDLKALVNRESRERNRISLTISHFAFETLLQDWYDFSCSAKTELTRSAKKDSPHPPSELVNHLVIQFLDEAQSSIAIQLKMRRLELERILSDTPSASRTKLIQTLMDNYYQDLQTRRDALIKTSPYPQQRSSFQIRLNSDAQIALFQHFSDTALYDECSYYKSNIGSYLQALLEEYARLSSIERERIYYKPWLAENSGTISKAIQNGKELKIQLRKDKKTQWSAFRPYKIEKSDSYHYLVGYWSTSSANDWRIACIRITSLRTVDLGVYNPLSKIEKKSIEDQILHKGIAYLSDRDNSSRILVRLTPEGEALYRQIRHNRPACLNQPGPDRKYIFECSWFQAKTYFVRFGKHAEILEPADLRKDMAAFFQEGLSVYQ